MKHNECEWCGKPCIYESSSFCSPKCEFRTIKMKGGEVEGDPPKKEEKITQWGDCPPATPYRTE